MTNAAHGPRRGTRRTDRREVAGYATEARLQESDAHEMTMRLPPPREKSGTCESSATQPPVPPKDDDDLALVENRLEHAQLDSGKGVDFDPEVLGLACCMTAPPSLRTLAFRGRAFDLIGFGCVRSNLASPTFELRSTDLGCVRATSGHGRPKLSSFDQIGLLPAESGLDSFIDRSVSTNFG